MTAWNFDDLFLKVEGEAYYMSRVPLRLGKEVFEDRIRIYNNGFDLEKHYQAKTKLFGEIDGRGYVNIRIRDLM